MEKNHQTPATFRKARTRTLIQLGGLLEKSGLMETFDLNMGDDLQKNLPKKNNVFALLGGLIELKDLIKQNELSPHSLKQKGAKAFERE